MIRVYFDWNIFSSLKQKKDNDKVYKSIYTIINKKNDVSLVYSSAHLNDLIRGISDAVDDYTYEDLDFLQSITDGHCLQEDFERGKVITLIKNATEYFNEILEDKTHIEYNLDTLFLSEHKEVVDQFKLIPTGIDLNFIDNDPNSDDAFKSIFINLRLENNFYNLLKDINELLSDPKRRSLIYKNARNYTVKDMKIDTDSKKWGDAFTYLDNVLSKNSPSKTFLDVVEDNLQVFQKGKKSTRFDTFVNTFTSLDKYGYYRDKELTNLIDDATHAFYGAHCDFFVTNDNNTFEKAKAVYNKFNIETKVVKAGTFSLEFYSMYSCNTGTKGILQRIPKIIDRGQILLHTTDDMANPTNVYKIDHVLLNYFDRMQLTDHANKRVLTFYKKRQNYSGFLFWKEIESVIIKIVADFGLDNNSKGHLDDSDKDQLVKVNSWTGRIWTYQRCQIEVFYSDDEFGLCMRISIYL